MEDKDLIKVFENIASIQTHIEVLNREGGEMKDEQRKMNLKFDTFQVYLANLSADNKWVKKIVWAVLGTGIATITASILGLVLNK